MKKNVIFTLVCLLLCSGAMAADYTWSGDFDKDSPVYAAGEKMVFTVKFYTDGQPVDGTILKWKRTGDDGIVQSGEGVSSVDGFKIETSSDKPGFVHLVVTAYGDDGQPITRLQYGWQLPFNFELGACVEPEKLQGLPEPKDFDKFWASRKELLKKTPLKILEMVEVEGNEEVIAYDVKIACPGAMPVSGYLTMPRNAEKKSLPAVVEYDGYGIRSSHKNLRGGKNAINLSINAHGILNGQPQEYYANLGKTTLKGYALSAESNATAEKSYFHDMMLRVLRSLEFVKSLPQWNGKDLKASGGSQGGMQSLIAAGLDSDVTECYAWSPWNCDIGGEKLGREGAGWGVEYTPAMEYFDPIHHVKRVNPKCKLYIIANLGDYTCPPSGVWIAYNNFPGPKKMEIRQGCTHSWKAKDFSRYFIEDSSKR